MITGGVALLAFFLMYVQSMYQAGFRSRDSAHSALVLAIWTASPFAVAESIALPRVAWVVPAITSVMAWMWGMRYVRDLSAIEGLQQPSDELRAIVLEMSRRMGLPPPRLGVVPSGGALSPYAWSGCTASPVVIVSDGFVHRLDVDEQRAVIAHELGHFTTWSLWFFLAAGGLSACICTVLAQWCDPIAMCLLCWPLAIVMGKILSRPFETSCDALAAEHVSPDAMSGALERMAALQAFNTDWKVLPLLGADDHPRTEARIARLRGTPRSDGVLARLAPWIALSSALALMSVGLLVEGSIWHLLGYAICLAPIILGSQLALKLAQSDANRRRQLLVPDGHPETPYLVVAGVGILIAVALHLQADLNILLILPPVLAFIYLGVRRRRRMTLRQRVANALGARAFGDALALAANHPEWLAEDAFGRHDVGIAQILGGHSQEGYATLRAVAEQSPGFLLPWINLAEFQQWTDPETALRDAERGVALAPEVPEVQCAYAEALLALGRTSEARAAISLAMDLGDRDAFLPVLARVILLSGDLDQCGEILDEANRRAPGNPYTAMVQTELALAQGESGAEPFARALSSLEQIPIHCLGPWVEELRARISPEPPLQHRT